MDGNRRYARRHQKEIKEGHSDGFVALQRVSLSELSKCFSRILTVIIRCLRYV